jgi:hypothetical protein
MNKRAILILGVLLGLLAMLCFGHFFGTRKQETGDSPSTFRITPFDERSKTFVLERDAKWVPLDRDYSADSGLMQAAGLIPSVPSLTNILTASTPVCLRWKLYWWFFPRKAVVAKALAGMKEGFLDLGALDRANVNPTLLVSDDGHLGLLWLGTNAVLVFQDGTNGLQGTQYRKKANP